MRGQIAGDRCQADAGAKRQRDRFHHGSHGFDPQDGEIAIHRRADQGGDGPRHGPTLVFANSLGADLQLGTRDCRFGRGSGRSQIAAVRC